ncbi:hypothetical protein B0H14DRAFT_3871399 [Mycena olivaceomarginata]|nr:hypothetical protein B0H14DRAFT_3871399 [Mycena olivaceomarginata]
MPVSFAVAAHPAKPYPFPEGRDGYTADEMLAKACKSQHATASELLQFSLPVHSETAGSGRDMSAKIPWLVPNPNGFVATLLDAYSQDRALVIRPDDVWLAILCQFNLFVNARAEVLRANFVAHEGKKELVIYVNEDGATRYTVEFGKIARQFTDLINKKRCRPGLARVGDPKFYNDDRQRHHRRRRAAHGDAQAILRRADWVDIFGRLEKLKEYGLETTAWYHLLRPVIGSFVAAFDDPTNAANANFWQRIAHYEAGGSGRGDYYTGWITAFTVFDKEGKWRGNPLTVNAIAPESDPSALTAAEFWTRYLDRHAHRDLVLDDTPYHRLAGSAIPPGFAEVDVIVIDNGVRFDCTMIGGHVAMRVGSSGDEALSVGGRDDTVAPMAGWWLFVKDEGAVKANAEKVAQEQRGSGLRW